ncbi:BRAMP [Serinicoccus hydrothermalis]|uniref:BRAMP n=1 Tax=Serinicoccus hydrothermalis TaxID=1758689 RepID=A0A1B1N9P8_9MICO|nr:NAD(P)H-dependent oxidoreductase [Serinicoccus hydrothermalis]ANS78131.1 BRAMP [Serinicoccus hydrothermalis]
MDAPRYDSLTALLVNCSLTPQEEASHTGRLLDAVDHLMTGAGVTVDRLHAVNHDIAPGVQPDMREHGWDSDEWPDLWPRVMAADILVLGTPLWLGEESSVCRTVIERLYAMSGELNDAGQSIFYGKVGGAVITGNEDGVKHASMSLLFALQHLGLVIPPQADCGWIGEIGPGPSYGDPREGQDPVGLDSDFTRQNATIMSWNLMHLAGMLRSAGGLPTYGNDRNALADGERFGYAAPGPVADAG